MESIDNEHIRIADDPIVQDNLQAFLKNDVNKIQLIAMLINVWKKMVMVYI